MQRRKGEIYVHYLNTDKRLDEWVPEDTAQLLEQQPEASSSSRAPTGRKRKRKQQQEPSRIGSSSPARQPSVDTAVEDAEPLVEEVAMTEEEYDIQHHKQITAQRNFDKVNFGAWQIKTWCAPSLSFLLFLHWLTHRVQVLLPIPFDRGRDRRTDVATCRIRRSFAYTRRSTVDRPLARPHFRLTRRGPWSHSWRGGEIRPLGLRSLLQVHG